MCNSMWTVSDSVAFSCCVGLILLHTLNCQNWAVPALFPTAMYSHHRLWVLTAGHTAGGQTAIGQNLSPVFLCTEENVCWVTQHKDGSLSAESWGCRHTHSFKTDCASQVDNGWRSHGVLTESNRSPDSNTSPDCTLGYTGEIFVTICSDFLLELTGNKALLILQIPRSVEPAVYCYDRCSYISHLYISWDSVDSCLSH